MSRIKYQTKIVVTKVAAVLLAFWMLVMSIFNGGVIQSTAATTGVVNTAVLNLRSGPSTDYGVITTLSLGTSVEITETVRDSSNDKWYKVSVVTGGSTRSGYVSSDYITLSSANTGTGVVDVAALNVRSGPGTGYSSYGVIGQGTTVTISGTSGDWYRITAMVNGNSREGYAFAEYIVKAGTGDITGGTTLPSGTIGTVDTDLLNIRSGNSTAYSVVGSLTRGTQITLVRLVDGWYEIRYTLSGSTRTGYVSGDYITRNDSSSEPVNETTLPSGTTGRVNTPVLNVRTGYSTAYSVADSLTQGTSVTLLAESDGWYRISYAGGKTGYVSGAYIDKEAQTPTPNPETKTGTVRADALNVRRNPSITSSIIGLIYEGSTVTILAESNGWYQVQASVNGSQTTGYVSAEWITVGDTSGSGGSTTTRGYVAVSELNARSGPGTNYSLVGELYYGDEVTILEDLGDWYKVTATVSGTSRTVYLYSAYVSTVSSGIDTPSDDAAFEAQIAAFPSDYRSKLRALHEKYPNWKFVPVNTGLDWNAVVAAESVVGICTIQKTSDIPYSYLSTEAGAYDWATDTYQVKDGSDWYSADSRVIAYYLDPRNFLNEQRIFQFESLAYENGHSSSVVRNILSGSFMSGNYTEGGITRSYTDTFMTAGETYGISPYFLSSRVLQEVGYSGSESVSGKSPLYPGIYNFYNIGAFDSSSGGAITNGLAWASGYSGNYTTYSRPWNTRYKSITGGAEYIAESYINVGQNTTYFQKFNVVNTSSLYAHQYQTGVYAPYHESLTVYQAYRESNALDGTIVFRIPIYNNMPSSPASLPASAGNPNAYIKSLSVTGSNGSPVTLTPTFRYNVMEYTAVVSNNVSSVTINGSPISNYARISGTGTRQLSVGENTISVTCTAQNGTVNTYTIKITRRG